APAGVLHRVVGPAVLGAGVEDRDDVGMAERGEDAHLAAEPLGLGGHAAVEDLDRDLAAELRVAREVDASAAAAAELADERVPAELAGRLLGELEARFEHLRRQQPSGPELRDLVGGE